MKRTDATRPSRSGVPRKRGEREPDPRREPRPGYAETELKPKRKPPKAPGEGGPFEPQNDPRRKPGRQNG
jgi:hypothetical protein